MRWALSPDELLDAFFDAIVRGDLDRVGALYSDDVGVWHNVTGRTVDRDASVAILRFFVETVADRRYEIAERSHWPGGALQRHVVHGRAADGEPVTIPACVVFGLGDGRIRSIHEYVDSAHLGPMRPPPR